MELPHIGDQCSDKTCRQLDFLPVKCDGCKQSFCGQHWTYEGHNCPSPRLKDVQVPVCPLCDKPVPSKPGALPDEAVSRHLDRDCKNHPDQKKNPRCSKTKCKTRELIRVDCNQCGLNFCLKHRHPQDHECSGKTSNSLSASGRAAMTRQQQQQPKPQQNSITKYFSRQSQPSPSTVTTPNPRQLQGNLSEDEALARALQASLTENTGNPSGSMSQEEQDRMLAMALAQSEREARATTSTGSGTTNSNDKSCLIS